MIHAATTARTTAPPQLNRPVRVTADNFTQLHLALLSRGVCGRPTEIETDDAGVLVGAAAQSSLRPNHPTSQTYSQFQHVAGIRRRDGFTSALLLSNGGCVSKIKPFKKRLLRYIDQGGLCYWCGCKMVVYKTGPNQGKLQKNFCTLDHLDSRLSGVRGQRPKEVRTVAACHGCNKQRGIDECMIHAVRTEIHYKFEAA